MQSLQALEVSVKAQFTSPSVFSNFTFLGFVKHLACIPGLTVCHPHAVSECVVMSQETLIWQLCIMACLSAAANPVKISTSCSVRQGFQASNLVLLQALSGKASGP